MKDSKIAPLGKSGVRCLNLLEFYELEQGPLTF